MANIGTSIAGWSVTAISNQPDSADAASVQADLQAIQAGVRYLETSDTLAAAATTDLSTKDAASVVITGSGVTITSFGTLSAGIKKYLRFEGANTVTYNVTSLITPRAANITTAANDLLIVESLGSGNWRVIGVLPKVIGGATGGGADDVFYENSQTVTSDYTITANKNAMTAGPVSINSGVSVTIPSGSVWSVI